MQISSALPSDLGERLERLIADIEREQGAPPFGEILLAAMRENRECIGLVADRNGMPEAYGYATPGPGRKIWNLEVAAPAGLYNRILERMLDRLEADGVPEAVLWIHSRAVDPSTDRVHLERALYRMSASLPIVDSTVPPEDVVIRSMDVADDAAALMDVNNRAFGNHPEQGGWTPRDLETRLAFEWFDPAGVRTAWMGRRMVAFNWTKVHSKPGPDGETVGEIYSIAVHPSFQQRGLGRIIAVEGLRYLASERGADRAILYVDASNSTALQLYRSLGFATDHVDRAYRWKSSNMSAS